MIRLFERWFECEDGHITAGNENKSKCGAELWQLQYVKGKRKRQWIEETVKAKPCGKKIISEGEIPREIDYTVVWDYKIAHAFLVGQKLDSEFLVGFQKAYCAIWDEIKKLKEKMDGKNSGGDPARADASQASS